MLEKIKAGVKKGVDYVVEHKTDILAGAAIMAGTIAGVIFAGKILDKCEALPYDDMEDLDDFDIELETEVDIEETEE